MTLHVVPGPDGHGVVRHGLGLQRHWEGRAELLRCQRLDDLPDGALAGEVVVVQVTDRVLAGSPDEGLRTFRRVARGAARVTVVLHDLPQRSDGSSRRARTQLYAALAAQADEVVVSSRHERLLLAAALRWARPQVAGAVLDRTHVLPLPVEPSGAALAPREATGDGSGPLTVVTLGYLYPGKGLEQVVEAVGRVQADPRLAGLRVEVVNLGGVSAGHDDLVDSLTELAARAGVRWRTTGWVDDADLPALLAEATVPVAAHQHLSASGSIATWLGAGRRPVVLTSRYAAELAGRLPGSLRLTTPAGLATALADALAGHVSGEPTTWLDDPTALGPSWAESARRLLDLATRPAVSVVVPYYRDQELLDLIVSRLQAQAGVVGGLQLVVADDGSPQAPTLAPPDAAVEEVVLVRQEDLGFRAAAARNLGLARTSGRVVLLLDGDTVPEDGYVAAMQAACTRSPTLAVGHRRHAQLRGRPWPPPEQLPEPRWLLEGYAATRDLVDADDSGFRFVISAVMALSRQVVDAVGGFDATMTGYGGEDWEMAWRAWLAGADLRHLPEAVAWHDGPDLSARDQGRDPADLAAVKNAETARLAPRLPHPLVRGRGWFHEQPDVVALVDAAGWTDGQLTCAVEALLRHGDVGVWVEGAGPDDPQVQDPRVHHGRPTGQVLRRARATVRLTSPVAVLQLPWPVSPQDLTGTVAGALVDDPASGVRVVATRLQGREHLHGDPAAPCWLPAEAVEVLPAEVLVERWRQQSQLPSGALS